MSHDHEAVQLAVASLDFELSPEERRRMEIGLAACPECAAIAASHGDLVRLLDRLPVHDASPQVRQRIMRAALVPPRQHQWPVLLVAAALLGLLIAGAAAVGAFRERPPLEAAVVDPSATPPAHGDEESSAPSSSPAPGSSDSAGDPPALPGLGTPFAADTLAEVVSPRLRIRSEPRVAADSIKYEPLLDVGDRLFILDGPVVASDYEWYQVVAWRPDNLYATWPTGWVARADHDGSPWVRSSADACPSGTVTTDVVSDLHPQERVACFGDRPLRLRAFVWGDGDSRPCTPEPMVACVEGPAWLTGDEGWRAEADTTIDTPSIGGPPLAIDPDGSVAPSALEAGAMVELGGAFDHPAARQCRPGAAGADAEPMSVAAAQLACRARFVVTSVNADTDYPAAGAAGVTVSDDLRVRAAPGLTSERYELLPIGTDVWVVDGPVVEADYEWFQVIVPTLVTSSGTPRVGWVAASDHGREAWLARSGSDCPDRGTLNVEDLADLTLPPGPGTGGLACFGSSGIRFEGAVSVTCGVENHPGWQMTPEWLSGNAHRKLSIQDLGASVVAYPHPSLAVPLACGETAEGRYLLEGHFDDTDAALCDATIAGGPQPPDLEVITRHWCQSALVIDRLEPVGRPRGG
jgi:hypothetical protein